MIYVHFVTSCLIFLLGLPVLYVSLKTSKVLLFNFLISSEIQIFEWGNFLFFLGQHKIQNNNKFLWSLIPVIWLKYLHFADSARCISIFDQNCISTCKFSAWFLIQLHIRLFKILITVRTFSLRMRSIQSIRKIIKTEVRTFNLMFWILLKTKKHLVKPK